MDEAHDRDRLVALLRRLLDDLERHESDYHHVTPPRLVEEARALLRAFDHEARRETPEPGAGPHPGDPEDP